MELLFGASDPLPSPENPSVSSPVPAAENLTVSDPSAHTTPERIPKVVVSSVKVNLTFGFNIHASKLLITKEISFLIYLVALSFSCFLYKGRDV